MLAMKGARCVAIASDTRFGVQTLTVSTTSPKVFALPGGGRSFVGLAGLSTDAKTVHDALRYHLNLHALQEERSVIEPAAIAKLLSALQYGRRFAPWFVEPVIAGLDSINGEPYICSMDTIGCMNVAPDFVVAGTASDQLFGMCESLWQPDLDPEDLFEVVGQALLNACNRDALSGWGAIVHIMYVHYLCIPVSSYLCVCIYSCPDRVITRHLKSRQD